jgi:hypothetical protein
MCLETPQSPQLFSQLESIAAIYTNCGSVFGVGPWYDLRLRELHSTWARTFQGYSPRQGGVQRRYSAFGADHNGHMVSSIGLSASIVRCTPAILVFVVFNFGCVYCRNEHFRRLDLRNRKPGRTRASSRPAAKSSGGRLMPDR